MLQQPPLPSAPAYALSESKTNNMPPVHYSSHGHEHIDVESNQPPCRYPLPGFHQPVPVPNACSAPADNPRLPAADEPAPASPKKTRQRRCLMLVGVAIIVLLTCVVTGVLVYHLGSRQPIPTNQVHTNCVSCDYLQKALAASDGRVAVNVAELDIRDHEGKLLCCLKVTAKTDAILEMLLESARKTARVEPQRRVQNQTGGNPGSPSSTVPSIPTLLHRNQRNQAAALVGIEKAIPTSVSDDDIYTLKEWGVSESTAMYIRPRIKYNEKNGHFTVPYDGLYSINIHLSLVNTGSGRMVNFRQRLIRFNRHWPQRGDEVLATDAENVPSNEQRTSGLTFTVHLREDDEVFVQVSPASVIVEASARSFFCVVFESA